MTISWTFKQAALVTSLLGGLTLPERSLFSQETNRAVPATPHAAEGPTPRELKRLFPYLAALPQRALLPSFARSLIENGTMSPATQGTVLSRYHLFFVSWDERGLLLEKSVLRSPRASHSAVIALRTNVHASTSLSGDVTHTLNQNVTLISFLPSSAQGIHDKVRINLFTITDPNGTHGVNWQGIDFLLHPNAYLGGTPMTTSVSHPVAIAATTYWGIVRRAEELDRQRKPYHVLSSSGLREGSENCITGVAGVLAHLPNAPQPPFTGPLRGQEATDMVARAILEAAKVPTDDHGHYESAHDEWTVHEFLRATPSAQSGIRWYALRKW